MRTTSSRDSQIDWLIIGLRWLLLFSVLGVVLLSPPSGNTAESNPPQTALILLLFAAGFNLLAMVLLVFDVSVRFLAPASLIVDTIIAVALLAVTGVSKRFGGVRAIEDLSVAAVRKGEIVRAPEI